MAIPTMITMLVMVLYTMVDTFFIGQMGIAGAAIATTVGNIAAFVYYLLYFRSKDTSLSIHPKDFHMGDKIALDVITVGIPSTLNNILMSVAGIILNVKLMEIFRFTALCSVIMGVVLTAVLLIFKNGVIRVFLDNSEVIAYGNRMLTALLVTGPVIGILFLCINAIQGMGKAVHSLILSVCRQGVIFIPALYILSNFFGLNGLMYSQAVADILTLIVAMVLFLDVYRKMKHAE